MTNFVSDWHMIETFHNLLCYKNKTIFLELLFLEVFADGKNVLKYAGTKIILLFIFININIIIIIIIIITFRKLVKWGVSDFTRWVTMVKLDVNSVEVHSSTTDS